MQVGWSGRLVGMSLSVLPSIVAPRFRNSIIHDPVLSEGNKALITELDGSPDWRLYHATFKADYYVV